MRLLVAIHDVAPPRAAGVGRLWELCQRHGVRPALFVVPNWHGEWPLERCPRLVAWLGRRAALGAEIFLHGERHDEAGTRRRLGDSLRTLGRTAGEAEFLALDAAAARSRIERGVRLLRSLGLDPLGFVAPAWLAGAAARRAVAACGLRCSEDARAVYVHDRPRRIATPVIRWSARTSWRAALSVAVARLRRGLHRHHPLLRLGLHPTDLDDPRTARSLAECLARAVADRRPCRYGEL